MHTIPFLEVNPVLRQPWSSGLAFPRFDCGVLLFFCQIRAAVLLAPKSMFTRVFSRMWVSVGEVEGRGELWNISPLSRKGFFFVRYY